MAYQADAFQPDAFQLPVVVSGGITQTLGSLTQQAVLASESVEEPRTGLVRIQLPRMGIWIAQTLPAFTQELDVMTNDDELVLVLL